MSEMHHGEDEAELRILQGLRLAVELSVVILVIESVGALLSRSLSLTVDAIHNVPDILAFSVSWWALRSTSKGATGDLTFGAHRLETFAGVLNAALVVAVGVIFAWAALASLSSGGPSTGAVDPVWLLLAAAPTLALRAVNLYALGRLPGKVRELNLSSVMVHLASDIAITGALLAAGILLVLRPTWAWADPMAALVIAGLLVYEAVPLLREGWNILTERTPPGISLEAIQRSALRVPGVEGVHDIHVWSVCSSLVCMTAHVGVRDMPMRDCMVLVARLRERMENEFGIVHATFEIEGSFAL